MRDDRSFRGAPFYAALLALGVACGMARAADPGEGTALVVTTDKGAVRGAVANGIENFLDIPYAAPPVGPLRWAPPQPAAAWSDVRSAARSGPYCTQRQNFDSPQGPALDEDCLSINVQRPVGTRAGARLPVYVYIHGGGYATGSGVRDAQTRIVQLNGIVGVSLNYRLGALGFLALPGLSGSDTGNYGLMDQQAALLWVQRNIAAFGGDPAAVTIGGESAGGWSVCAHLAAPGSRGTFRQALMESGSCISHSLSEASADGAKVAAKLGCPTGAKLAECLRGKPVADILAAQDMLYFPTYGTPFLPDAPSAAVGDGRFLRVPVLIGATRDEVRSFSRKATGWTRAQYEGYLRETFGANAPLVLETYPYPAATDPTAVAYQVGAVDTDAGSLGAPAVGAGIGGCGDRALTIALARYVPVHAYEFSHRSGPGWYPTPGYVWGAGHAAELTYLYPQHDGGKTYAAFSAGERRLSDELVRAWGAFVKSGDPTVAGQTAWPAYAPTDTTLSFNVGGITALSDAAFSAEHHCALWNKLWGTPAGPPPG